MSRFPSVRAAMCRQGPTRRFAWSLAGLVAVSLTGGTAAPARAQSEPHYWRQRVFFIPYQPNTLDPQAAKIDKVQLLVSRDGSQQWAVLQEAEPNVRGFSYHAPSDGEYAFALRMSDRRGRVWPEQVAQPLLRIVVDTQQPVLELNASVDASGQCIVRYEAKDRALKPQSLRLEAQTNGETWERVELGPPDVNQPDRLLGQAAWRPTSAGSQVKFRMTLADAAGNQGAGAAEASLVGPLLDPASGPMLSPPNLEGPSFGLQPKATTPSANDAASPALDWPTSNSFASDRNGTAPPPFQNVYTSGTASHSAGPDRGAEFDAPGAAPAPAADVAAPALLGNAPAATATTAVNDPWISVPSAAASQPGLAANAGNAAPQGAPRAGGTPWVNSLTFDLDYDIETVGPWGIAKVELWGTKDGGQNWQTLGLDQDHRSPLRVTVPAAGVYGFRIVIDGGNGVAAPTPQAGEAPELVVGVDLAAPQTELRPAELGQGALAGHLVVRWAATDDNLPARPAALFFSGSAEGPWTTIATDLENNGEYAWRLGREALPQVFLRLEVRDAAGNLAVAQSSTAVDLQLPRPTGRLRSVRPVEEDPARYRTASGIHPADG